MDPLPLLRDLVSVNSVNPGLVPGAPGEAEAAEVCRAAMRNAGLDVVVEHVRPGRPNVVGVIEGSAPGPAILFCGHLDTVGVDDMRDPFLPREEGGRLYGRGAQDMKGGVAAMIAAAGMLAALLDARPADRRGRHRRRARESGRPGVRAHLAADAAMSPSRPTWRSPSAHKGFAWFDIVTRGRAAHGSRPADGRDAILRMGSVLGALERLDRELQARAPVGSRGHGLAPRVDHRGRARAQQLPGHVRSADGAPSHIGRA